MTGRPNYVNEHVYVDETTEDGQRPVLDLYMRDVEGTFDAIACAHRLGLGWSASGYYCPTTDEKVEQREFRVTVWRRLISETLPMSPDPETKEEGS